MTTGLTRIARVLRPPTAELGRTALLGPPAVSPPTAGPAPIARIAAWGSPVVLPPIRPAASLWVRHVGTHAKNAQQAHGFCELNSKAKTATDVHVVAVAIAGDICPTAAHGKSCMSQVFACTTGNLPREAKVRLKC